jgi:hypothetical protein
VLRNQDAADLMANSRQRRVLQPPL